MANKRIQREEKINSNELYKELFRKRGVKYISQYPTPKLSHPNAKQIANLNRVNHVWKVGDRFYKLAHKYYGDAEYWWVIAWYNQRPTESHVRTGEVVVVPMPLVDVLPMLLQ